MGGRICGGRSPSGALPGSTARPPSGCGFSSTCAAASGCGCAVDEATDGAASAPCASSSAMRSPAESSSPTLTLSSLTTPANGAGTSMVALSDSRVMSPWSFSTRSPGLTSTSITGTWSWPLKSGTRTSRRADGAEEAASRAGSGAACAGGFAAAGGAAGLAGDACSLRSPEEAAPASAAASTMAITLPSDTVSPTLTLSSLTTPANGAGTSMVALSDSRVMSPWSFSTRSPGLTSTSITGTS